MNREDHGKLAHQIASQFGISVEFVRDVLRSGEAARDAGGDEDDIWAAIQDVLDRQR